METSLPTPICQGRTVNLPEGIAEDLWDDPRSPAGRVRALHVEKTFPADGVLPAPWRGKRFL